MGGINITCVFLREQLIEFSYFGSLIRPTGIVFRNFHDLKFFSRIIQQIINLRNRRIASGNLHPPFVFQPRIIINSICTVTVAIRTVKPVKQSGRCQIAVKSPVVYIILQTNLGTVDNLFTAEDTHRSIQHLTEFIHLNVDILRKPIPITASVSVGSHRSTDFTRHIRPYQFRSVYHRLPRQHNVFHDRNRTGCFHERIDIAVVFRGIIPVARRPSAIIEADAIIPGIATQISPEAITLDVEETILHRVLLATDEVLGMFRQQAVHFRVSLHISYGHHVGRIICLGKAYHKITSITVAYLQNVAEQRKALQKGRRTLLAESPELLCKVPTEEVRIFAEIILIHRKVMIGKTAVTTAGTLHDSPRTLLCTSLQPRACHGITIRTHIVGSRQ